VIRVQLAHLSILGRRRVSPDQDARPAVPRRAGHSGEERGLDTPTEHAAAHEERVQLPSIGADSRCDRHPDESISTEPVLDVDDEHPMIVGFDQGGNLAFGTAVRRQVELVRLVDELGHPPDVLRSRRDEHHAQGERIEKRVRRHRASRFVAGALLMNHPRPVGVLL
jgi:hypothetical protein